MSRGFDRLGIAGMGTAVPEHRMTQQQAVELAEHVNAARGENDSALRVLYRRSGVNTRHTVVPIQMAKEYLANAESPIANQLGPTTNERMEIYREKAPLLAARASDEALRSAEMHPADITHLVTVTCTGFTAPGVDVGIIDQLGLRRTVERVQVGFMGCHGAINGLRVARGLVAAEPTARVLLCAVELCSLHFAFDGSPAHMVGNSIFADGAAALVATAAQEDEPWRVLTLGSCIFPDSTDAIQWHIRDHGFDMVLSPKIPDLIARNLRDWLDPWLAEQGVPRDRVASWAIHPGGPRILTAVEMGLGLDSQHTAVSREILSEYGNMSSPTMLFILQRLMRANAPRPCVALGFGPGLVAEAAILV